jgi:hypothetical protein
VKPPAKVTVKGTAKRTAKVTVKRTVKRLLCKMQIKKLILGVQSRMQQVQSVECSNIGKDKCSSHYGEDAAVCSSHDREHDI